jgi:low temperature requirement protein LtrA
MIAVSTGSGEVERVAPLELFFDLVFVLAITQVTGLLASDPTWAGLARGMLVLAMIWWAWAAYAWLTNEVDPGRTGVRVAIFASMIAMLITALAVPKAFEGEALLFAGAYLTVRVLHIAVFAAASDELQVLDAVRALAPSAIAAPALLIPAAFVDGVTQIAIWIAVVAFDYGAGGLRGIGGWRLSPGHFAERHGLIVIIALGESIVAVGAGVAGPELEVGIVAAAALGVAIAASLWWVYFDSVALVAERKLRAQPSGRPQNTMARDSYSYLHLAMIAGIVLFALGIKKTLGDVSEPLSSIPALGLCGGIALYLVALVAFRVRTSATLDPQRIVAGAVCLATLPLALEAPPLIELSVIAAICITVIGYEARSGAQPNEPSTSDS